MSALPDAVQQHPACGVCGVETDADGDDFVCRDCQLVFDHDDLSASFLNPETPACGAPCDNTWHGDNLITPGIGYDCGDCKLPSGHQSLHWTGCRSKTLPVMPKAGQHAQR